MPRTANAPAPSTGSTSARTGAEQASSRPPICTSEIATRARSAAFVDNGASLRVSEKLGYRPDGTATVARRGRPVDDVRLLVTPGEFRRPGWELTADGVAACLPMLSVAPV